jgi:hypothetical protein
MILYDISENILQWNCHVTFSEDPGYEMKLVDSTKKMKKRGNTLEKKFVRHFQRHIFIHNVHQVDP